MKIIKQFAVIALLASSSQLSHAADTCLNRSDLEGLYGFHIKIGEREFLDLININKACQAGWVSGTLEGNLTVPERFTTKIVDGRFIDLVGPADQPFTENISLSIDTLENGQPLKARYEITDTRDPVSKKHTCVGKVYFDGEDEPVPMTCVKFDVVDEYRN
jgi:hypothetical protein